MPRVPQYGDRTPQVGLKPLKGIRAKANVSDDDFGVGFGKALGEIGELVDKRAEEMATEQREAKTKELDVSFNAELRQILNNSEDGYFTKRGKDASEGYKGLTRDIEKLEKKYLSKAENDPALRELLDKQIRPRARTALDRASWHAAGQHRAYLADVSSARIEDATQDALADWTDPSIVNRSVALVGAEIREHGHRNGQDPATIDQAVALATSNMHRKVIDNLVGTNPNGARVYFNAYKDQIPGSAQDDIERALRSAEADTRERASSDLELRVLQGQAGPEDIESAFDNRMISGPKRVQLHREIMRRREGQDLQQAQRELIASGQPLDPRNKDHVGAVDYAYGLVAQQLREQGQGTRPVANEAAALMLAKQTGILPNPVRAQLRTVARTPEAKDAGQMLELFDLLESQTPAVLEDLPARDVAILDTAADLRRGGVGTTKALEMAIDQRSRSEAERDVIAQRFRAETKDAPNPEALQDLLDADDHFDREWFFTGAPKAPAAMSADFDRLVESYYQSTGNVDQARDLAFKALKRTWVRSDINGKPEIMRHGPEHDLGIPTKVLRKSLDKALEAIGEKPDGIHVISDAKTALSTRGLRSYAVMRIRKDGLPEIVLGPNGTPLRWRPDGQALVSAEQKEALKRAEALREAHEQQVENLLAPGRTIGGP